MSYIHITEKDRYVISHLRSMFSLREIARRIGRHHTSISREIKRKSGKGDSGKGDGFIKSVTYRRLYNG